MKSYKISQIAKLSGASVKAIRLYEEKGLLAPSRQHDSNYRLYADDSVAKILNIKLLQGLGLSLKEISMIHQSKQLESENLCDILMKQLSTTLEKISELEERKQILKNIIEKIHEGDMESSEILTAKEKDLFMGITTGFSKLDQLLKSESKGQLVVIAARPGLGKTALTIHIAYNLLEQSKLPICFFSTEFDHKEWVNRIAVAQCEVDRFSETLTDSDRERLETAREVIKSKPIFYRNNQTINVEEIIKSVNEIEKPLGAIVIDYLQDLGGDIDQSCKLLKELAVKMNCPVLVLSTVSKDVDRRESVIPTPEDVNNYSSMKDHLDNLLIVSRKPELKLSERKGIAKIDVYSKGSNQYEHINLIWDGSYCGYSDTL
ncbi:hypothetical protein A9Q84_19105 [Halobacteriovorax marinus]|uniref:DNA helicase n=1 Tax=Halobacteriovorax marinus TaxID=97084 RepID=A0A1Y5F860_9BACT|nr:hypothetical protein A9Q84_19105 [Halobacteriovorax marinus]